MLLQNKLYTRKVKTETCTKKLYFNTSEKSSTNPFHELTFEDMRTIQKNLNLKHITSKIKKYFIMCKTNSNHTLIFRHFQLEQSNWLYKI